MTLSAEPTWEGTVVLDVSANCAVRRPELLHLRDVVAHGGNSNVEHWRRLYAEGAAVLDQDEHVAGAEALVGQALTNGLLAVVSAHWPSETTRKDGSFKPAGGLLKVIEGQVGLLGGVAHVEIDEQATELAEDSTLRTLSTKALVSVQVNALHDAVSRTQVARHGRGPDRQVTRNDVQALLELGAHPALRVLTNH